MMFPRNMFCFRNISVDTPHKGDINDIIIIIIIIIIIMIYAFIAMTTLTCQVLMFLKFSYEICMKTRRAI